MSWRLLLTRDLPARRVMVVAMKLVRARRGRMVDAGGVGVVDVVVGVVATRSCRKVRRRLARVLRLR